MMTKKEYKQWIAWLRSTDLRQLEESLATRVALVERKAGNEAELLAEWWDIKDEIDRRKANNG
jgi:hypothetical protein